MRPRSAWSNFDRSSKWNRTGGTSGGGIAFEVLVLEIWNVSRRCILQFKI